MGVCQKCNKSEGKYYTFYVGSHSDEKISYDLIKRRWTITDTRSVCLCDNCVRERIKIKKKNFGCLMVVFAVLALLFGLNPSSLWMLVIIGPIWLGTIIYAVVYTSIKKRWLTKNDGEGLAIEVWQEDPDLKPKFEDYYTALEKKRKFGKRSF